MKNLIVLTMEDIAMCVAKQLYFEGKISEELARNFEIQVANINGELAVTISAIEEQTK